MTRMIRRVVGVVAAIAIGVLVQPGVARADHPVLSGPLSVSYFPVTGQLVVSGQYYWTSCTASNTARIPGFALFIDGTADGDTTIADPRTVTAEALEGTGMHLVNDGKPCTSYTGPFSDSSHNVKTNPVLASAPTYVCVVLYDVRLGVASGSHSQIGAGANRNTDNSFEENANAFPAGTCVTVTPPPPPPPQYCAVDLSATDTRPYTTYTQGGWGASPSGTNAGSLLSKNFSSLYPGGRVTIGGNNTVAFTSSAAIDAFLPQGGTVSALTQSYVNPTNLSLSVLAGQVLAAQLSVDSSNHWLTKPGLGNLVVQSGTFKGWTVNQVLTLGNSALGGSPLPSGITLTAINDALTAVNQAFDGGTKNTGYLR